MKNQKTNTQAETKPQNMKRRNVLRALAGAGAAMGATLSLKAQQQLPPVTPTGGLNAPNLTNLQRWPNIQSSQEVVASTQVGFNVSTGPGWVNNSGRSYGNGPMDECTRRIVDYVDAYSESNLTPSLIETINFLMVDTLASFYGGFESEPIRIGARLAQTMPGPCTVAGYGMKSTYEMAAFTNAAMIRHTDFNTAPHNNEMFGGIFAVGEALHSTGPQVMAAMVISYEIVGALGATGQGDYDPAGWDDPYHSIGTAMACGKLMGLNKDQLANAVSLALVPHMPMYVCHIGTQSMWKGTHSAEQVRNGVWAAMLAREGMTGPYMPFEGRDGLISHIGSFTRDLRFPASQDGRSSLERMHGPGGGYKRVPSEGNTQNFHQNIAPEVLKWTTPDEIASMDIQLHYWGWQEICDPPKWDPRNRETADHSMPYNIARHLLDKDIYFDSWVKEKYMDPKARDLMSKITARPLLDRTRGGGTVLTVKKKNGEERTFMGGPVKPMSHDDLIQKHDRLADFMHIDRQQRDRVRKQWTNLHDMKDIGEAMQSIAKYGEPRPLSDKTPPRIS